MSDAAEAADDTAGDSPVEKVRLEFGRDEGELTILASPEALAAFAQALICASEHIRAGDDAEADELISDLLDPKGDLSVVQILPPARDDDATVIPYRPARQRSGISCTAVGCFAMIVVTLVLTVFGAVALFREVRELLR